MFDGKAFNKAKFSPRTALVPVPSLAAFFKDDEAAEFEVRSLSGNEMALCNDALARRANIELVITAMRLTGEHKEALDRLLGSTDELSPEIAKRLEMLNIVFPGLGYPTWIKVCDAFPVVFYELTNKILELTGQGKALEKPKPSGEVRE